MQNLNILNPNNSNNINYQQQTYLPTNNQVQFYQNNIFPYSHLSLGQINEQQNEDENNFPLQTRQQQLPNQLNPNMNSMSELQQKTKVLLVCIYNKKSTLIRHDILYKLFSTQGQVQKILIFEKSKIWKAFVEMGTPEQAQFCKEKLQNYPIFDDGSKISVYYSNMKELKLQNNNSGGVDYTVLKSQVKQMGVIQQKKSSITSNSTMASQTMLNNSNSTFSSISKIAPSLAQIDEGDNQEFMPFINQDVSNQGSQPQEKAVQSKVTISLPQLLSGTQLQNNEENKELNKEDKKIKILQQIESSLQIDQQKKIENSLKEIDCLIERKNISQSMQQFDPSNYINPLFLQENKVSRVLYVRGLLDPFMTVSQIYNIFSNFGNINKIIFIRNKSSCLIEYENQEQATNAKDLLNNKSFNQNTMKIFYSNYEKISLRKENNKDDIFIGSEETNRFKQNKQICVNTPSQILHVSNLKQETCNEGFLNELFSKYGKVECIKIIIQDSQKYMSLVKMGSLEQSISCAAYLHGQNIMGRKIQISFTNSKI